MATEKNNNGKMAAKMGATLTAKGVTFRVWAPFADKVFVTGSFNDWGKRNSLKRMADGVWEALVKTAKPNDQYKYIIVNGEQEMERIDPYAKHVTNSIGNAIIEADNFDWGDDHFSPPALNELVIYELHIGTFLDEPSGGPGDLGGVIERLPYLQELGVNAIQLMPPVEFPGGHSWGYNPSHIFAIESDYGGPVAFKALVKAAHEHGIAVIFDVVYNHFGPGDLDLWRFDGWSEYERGGIYFYNDIRGETPWGATRPDYGRPEVRQFIMDNALMWLNDYHVDGLRFDATSYIRNIFGNNYDSSTDIPDGWNLMQQINEAVHNLPQPRITITEDLQRNEWITKTTGEGGAGFDAQWAAEFVHPVRQALIVTDDAQRDMEAVANAIRARYNGDAFDRVIYTESHDEVANGRARLPEDIHPSQADSWFAKKRSMLGAGLVFTAPGIPMIFQGQEFLEDEWFHDQDPLDWAKTETFNGIVQYYRNLVRLRRNGDGVTRGLTGPNIDVYHVNNGDKILAFQRWAEGGPGDSVVVVANFANQHFDQYTIGLPAGGTWQVRLNSDAAAYDAEFGNLGGATIEANAEGADGQTHSAQISLPPYTLLILSQDK
ncbi:MAG: alpha-amylase family glycosyl hydrolase [Caldilineaceae bacterium]